MPGFRSLSGVPYSDVNLQTGHAHAPTWGQDSTVSEISTLQLEFRDLSHVTGDSKYEVEFLNLCEEFRLIYDTRLIFFMHAVQKMSNFK